MGAPDSQTNTIVRVWEPQTPKPLRVVAKTKKPFPNQKGAQYVLSKPGKKESEELLLSVVTAADSIESILKIGFESSMQIFNKKI